MLYKLAHLIKDHMKFIWDIIEKMNAYFFILIYKKKCLNIQKVLSKYQKDYIIREAKTDDIDSLVTFFQEQPEESFKFFHPHSFEKKTISKLIKNPSYLQFLVFSDSKLVGYFFMRSFINGKAFRGKIVDYRWRNKGIAKLMGTISMDVAKNIGVRLFGTISKENAASYISAKDVNHIKVLKEFDNGDLYIEYLPKD